MLNILLKAVCSRGHWTKAMLWLKSGVSSDCFTWNTLLQGSSQKQSWSSTLGILGHVQSQSLVDEMSFNTAIASQLVSTWKYTSSLLTRMFCHQLRRDVVGYSALASCASGDPVLWGQAVVQLQAAIC